MTLRAKINEDGKSCTTINPLGDEPTKEQYTLKYPENYRELKEDQAGIKPSWQSILDRNYKDALDRWQQAQSEAGKVYEIDYNSYTIEEEEALNDKGVWWWNAELLGLTFEPGTTHNIEVLANGKAKIL